MLDTLRDRVAAHREIAVGIFDKPDFQRMSDRGEWPRLVHYANYLKDPASSAEATKVARREVVRLVEYLYETAVWARQNSSQHGRRLPRRAITQINDATLLLRRIGAAAVPPLVASVRAYDDYGVPEETARTLYLTIVFDTLERMGTKAAGGLRELARVKDKTIRGPAAEVLERFVDRGLLESTGLQTRRSSPKR